MYCTTNLCPRFVSKTLVILARCYFKRLSMSSMPWKQLICRTSGSGARIAANSLILPAHIRSDRSFRQFLHFTELARAYRAFGSARSTSTHVTKRSSFPTPDFDYKEEDLCRQIAMADIFPTCRSSAHYQI